MTMTALRIAYAAGGDGEMALRGDMRNLAGFVRDPSAAVSAALLPLSCSVKYECKVRLDGLVGWISCCNAHRIDCHRRDCSCTYPNIHGPEDESLKQFRMLIWNL